jgi:integrase
MLIKDIRGEMIQKFYNDKLKNGRLDGKGGLSPKTIKNMHNMLHEALDQAYINDLIPRNPCKAVILPKIKKKEIRVLSPEEQQLLLSEARKERLGIGIVLDLFSGMRLGELLGLKWSNIDLTSGILTVKHTLNRLKNYEEGSKTLIVLGDPKTEKSKRQIPLHKIMIDELKVYKDMQDQEKEKAEELYCDQGFFLCNELGYPIDPRTYQDLFKRLLKRAKIQNAHFHCLRHTFATRSLEKGIPAKTVSEILGHANISTTLDLYSHVSLDLKRESIDKLSDLFK